MDVLFKIQLLFVAGTIGCTISAIISILAVVTPLLPTFFHYVGF